MLKVKANPLFTETVKLTVAGQVEPESVSFTFKHKGKTALEDWIKRTGESKGPAEDVALLDEVIASWSGVEAAVLRGDARRHPRRVPAGRCRDRARLHPRADGGSRKKLTQAALRLIGEWDDGSESTKALAAFGVKVEEEIGDGPLDIWPENATAVTVFDDMVTSWNVGPGGVIGLRYETLPVFLEINAVEAAKRRELLDDIKTMESAALEAMRRSKG